jgi:hypothetical protein
MKPESLHALIIDQHFGELTAEASELLELHLAQNADARAEVERILTSLSVTHDAVLRHPELARVLHAPVQKSVVRVPRRSLVPSWLARAAAIALLAGAAGFFVGRSEPRMASGDVESPAQAPRQESPWAKYRMSFDPAGEGMQVVRVDTENHQSLP